MNAPKHFFYKSNRLQQIRGFCYTVQLGSVSEAAAKMGLQQSAVSMQLQALERDLDVMLLTRNGPRFEITSQGQALYEMMLPHVESINSLPETFSRRLAGLADRSLNIAANQTSVTYLLPRMIGDCKKKFPDLDVTIRTMDREAALDLVRRDDIQAFIGAVQEISHEFDFYPLVTHEAILIARKDHPLITTKNFKISDITHYQVVRAPSSFVTVPMFDAMMTSYNVKPYVILEHGDWEIFKAFVANSDAFTMVSRLCYDPLRDHNIGVRGLRGVVPDLQYGIVVKKGRPLTAPLKTLTDMNSSVGA